MNPEIIIREILPSEVYILEDIMYETIYHPDKNNPYPKSVIYLPQVRIYWDNWGKAKDDSCLVSISNNKIIGAVWIRTFSGEIKGFGYIDKQTPEIAVALFDEYRNKGIGTQLMKRMIELANRKGFTQISLSITKGNPAINLYLRLDFEVIDENEEDYIMLLKLDI